jgi:ArsR family transcriptional regulator, arsenate/arsenite/antimonite-responsive transcriptional repressor
MAEDGRFERVAKALADPRRFQILESIARCDEVGCQRLCEQFPVAQPTMSHHLKELVRAGLIETWREGQFVYCRFRSDAVREYMAALDLRLGVAFEGTLAATAPPRSRSALPRTRAPKS